jgi:hypothetical protein
MQFSRRSSFSTKADQKIAAGRNFKDRTTTNHVTNMLTLIQLQYLEALLCTRQAPLHAHGVQFAQD